MWTSEVHRVMKGLCDRLALDEGTGGRLRAPPFSYRRPGFERSSLCIMIF